MLPQEDVKDFAEKMQELLAVNPSAFYYIKGYTDCAVKATKDTDIKTLTC